MFSHVLGADYTALATEIVNYVGVAVINCRKCGFLCLLDHDLIVQQANRVDVGLGATNPDIHLKEASTTLYHI